MLITKELLKKYRACRSGIKFFENNFKELDTDKIKVTGDYKGFYDWIQNLPEIKVGDNSICAIIDDGCDEGCDEGCDKEIDDISTLYDDDNLWSSTEWQ